MDPTALALIFIGVTLLLLASGIWIGLAMVGVGLFAMTVFTSRPVGDAMATTVWTQISLWSLSALPLFVWMGEILSRSRIAEGLFDGLSPLLRRLPGGLLHVNVAGCTAFAAVTGSSAATMMTVGRITVPALRRRGYPESLACGTLAGAGTLGLLIPPSITMIVYGVMVQESVGRLFMAGFLPGLMVAALFFLYLLAWGLATPVGRSLREARAGWGESLRGLGRLAPMAVLIGMVIGSIYLGIATPTEAAFVGVAGALLLSALEGSLTWTGLREGLLASVATTSMILLLLAGSAFVTLALGFSGMPRALAAWIGELDLAPWMLIGVLTVFYVILGCFLDGISMILLTIAVVEPLVRQAGIDMIWFGIFVVLVGEMALITPPVGFNLFLVQSLSGRDLGFVARAAFPFFLLMLLSVALLTAFPQIALWLPETLSRR